MAEHSQLEDTIPNGEEIVERFGGIRPMASKLDVPVTTVQGWKKRDAIPMNRRDEIISAASQYNISLKGLLSDSVANQNARAAAAAATIEEDPALRSAPAQPYKQVQAAQAARAEAVKDFVGIDLSQVRRTARTTSLITTTSLVALVAIAGFFLFGGDRPQRADTGLTSRVDAIEARLNTADTNTPLALGETVERLRGQVDSITGAISGNAEELARMAQTVAAGNAAPLLQRLAVLEQQLAQNPGGQDLQGVVQRMENMVSPQNVTQWDSTITELRGVVTGLQGRMDGLDVALADAKTQSNALATTLSDVTGRDLGAAAMLLALTQVRQAADRQTPFAEDLVLLRQVAEGTDPALAASVDRMAPYAETGVLSSAGLKKELQGLSNEIITAKLKGEDVSLKDRVMARLQGLFSLKKDGTPVAGGPERDLIAQASTQLDNNDVAGAMATLEQLQGPAADAATPWKQQATATLAMQTIDKQLVQGLMTKLRSVASGGSTPINLAPQQPQVQIQPEVQPAPVAPEVAQPVPAPQLVDPQTQVPVIPQSPVIIQQ